MRRLTARRPMILAGACLALVVTLALWLWSLTSIGHGDWHERRLVYRLEARNQTGAVQHNRELRVFVPPTIGARQQRFGIESNRPVQVMEAPGGNALAVIQLGDVPPYGVRMVRLDVRLRVRDHVAASDDAGDGVTHAMRTRFPVDALDLAKAAARLTADDALATLRAIHQWVGDHVEATGYLAGDRGALYALRAGQGDCTEFMSLTATLALRAGLTIRAVGGFPYAEDRVAVASQFHNWVEARAGERWWIADAQTGTFTDRMNTYVVVRRLANPATASVESQGLFLPMEGFDVRML